MNFKKTLLSSFIISTACSISIVQASEPFKQPNIIMLMSDDQGWGDVGYNGNNIIHTPELDKLSETGIKLGRFYAAAPVSSPTRGSVLTGRHPYRYGITWAGVHHLPDNEITLAEVLKENGYTTGHFGKWHVGELSKTINQSYKKGDLAQPEHYSPPWVNGFDVSFSTEAMIPTYNPYYYLGGEYGSKNYRHLQTEPVAYDQRTGGFRWRDSYWQGEGQIVDEWLAGDDSEILVNQTIKFIEDNEDNEDNKPFMAAVWFHTPHTPLVASEEDRARYKEHPIDAQHFYGAVTAMDRQIGRLREYLKDNDLDENTIIIFNSDNGPSYIQGYNSTGGLSGKKSELLEGGIRVPAIIEWPAVLKGNRTINVPMSTSDLYPTILAAANIKLPRKQPKLDGENILPILKGETDKRSTFIAFQSPHKRKKTSYANKKWSQYALMKDNFKLYSDDSGQSFKLFDIDKDPSESYDISSDYPKLTKTLIKELLNWKKETEEDVKDAY